MNKKQIAAILADMLTDLDWKDDAKHENGRYSCQCISCLHYFTGHKRRVMCFKCAQQDKHAGDAGRPHGN